MIQPIYRGVEKRARLRRALLRLGEIGHRDETGPMLKGWLRA
jgi:hypothetical protein